MKGNRYMTFLGIVLTIVFLILQCNGIIAWEWYTIVSPLFIVIGIKILKWIILSIIGIIAIIFVSKE